MAGVALRSRQQCRLVGLTCSGRTARCGVCHARPDGILLHVAIRRSRWMSRFHIVSAGHCGLTTVPVVSLRWPADTIWANPALDRTPSTTGTMGTRMGTFMVEGRTNCMVQRHSIGPQHTGRRSLGLLRAQSLVLTDYTRVTKAKAAVVLVCQACRAGPE